MQILAVVVLYGRTLDQSETILGLTRALVTNPQLCDSIGLLIWDNSPHRLKNQQLPIPFDYRHSGRNVGVSGAYNSALEIAEGLACPWLLLLDQDTTLPDHYLSQIYMYSQQLKSKTEIGGVVPFLIASERPFSPGVVRFHGTQPLPPTFSGVHPREISAVNSGALIRVEALRQIGGYDERFWLDYSDITMFRRMYRQGKRLYVANDLELSHMVSLPDYQNSMSCERYLNFLAAEGAYWDLYGASWENAMQTTRLAARLVKQHFHSRGGQLSRITWEHLKSRLASTRLQRLKQWERQLQQRRA